HHRPYLRAHAQELHPHPDRRPGQGGDDALRPDQGPHHLPHEVREKGVRFTSCLAGSEPDPLFHTVAGSSFSGSGWASTTSWPSRTSTVTLPPSASLPNSSSSASGRLIRSWISRAIGRAPICASKPCWASHCLASGVAL